ncbi:MAG: azurin [Parahaliea sp.]
MKKTIASLALLLATVLSNSALANECEIEITGNDAMQFDKSELTVPASCTEVTLTLTHIGGMTKGVMGHNWLLTTSANFQPVATAGMAAGADKDYVPEGDERVLAHTKLIGGGEKDSITFSVDGWDKSGAYTYFCSFPGHFAVMKGALKFV